MSDFSPDQGSLSTRTTRKTRAPYIQRACIECKRRKQRCSGRHPCNNCYSRSVQCNYGTGDDTESGMGYDSGSQVCLEKVSSQVQLLSEHVGSMQSELRALREVTCAQTTIAPKRSTPDDPGSDHSGRSPSKRRSNASTTLAVSQLQKIDSHYPGLTSADYSFKLAHLELMRLQGSSTPISQGDFNPADDPGEDQNPIKSQSRLNTRNERLEHISIDIFTEISLARTRDLVVSYSNSLGLLHPIVDTAEILRVVEDLYACVENVDHVPTNQISRYDVIMIRLMLAIALLSDQEQDADLIERCFGNVQQSLDDILHSDILDIRGVTVILLGAIYHLFSHRLRMAWRLCGIAASLTIELGLHGSEVRQRAVCHEMKYYVNTINLMWSILILDHGWSAALGLPRNVDDTIFMDNLLQSDSPYLRAMASYCKISSKIVNNSKPQLLEALYNEEQFQFINYQIDRWQESTLKAIPHNAIPGQTFIGDPANPTGALLYLRANQLRILLLRPVFFSDSKIKPDQTKVTTSLETAIQTISVLQYINLETDFYRKLYPFFSHFLFSATALIILVVTYKTNPDRPFQNETFITTDITQPLRDALSLSSSYQSLSKACMQHHERLASIVRLLCRISLTRLRDNQRIPNGNQIVHSTKEQHAVLPDESWSEMNGYLESLADLYPLLARDGQSLGQYQIPSIYDTSVSVASETEPIFETSLWNELDRLIGVNMSSVDLSWDITTSEAAFDL